MIAYVIGAACLAAWLLMMAPAMFYLRSGWVARRDRMTTLLTPDLLSTYFKLFWPEDMHVADLRQKFNERFIRTYGRRHYAFPLLVLGFVTAMGLWMTARTLRVWMGLSTDPHTAPAMAVAAFLGAYMWVAQDQLNRFRIQDFTVYEVWGGIYRIIIAVPLAYSLAAIFQEQVGVPLAFLLGAFPTKFLMTVARRVAAERYKFGESQETGTSELIQLQCVGKSQAERFEDEGYLTIAQLAWADPVDVTLRTNFNFYFVFDCQDQALLWVYLGTQVKDLYRYSLRGAQEATYLLERLKSDDVVTRQAATAALEGAAKVLGMDANALRGTLTEVKDDPYTQFLCALWHETPGTS